MIRFHRKLTNDRTAPLLNLLTPLATPLLLLRIPMTLVASQSLLKSAALALVNSATTTQTFLVEVATQVAAVVVSRAGPEVKVHSKRTTVADSHNEEPSQVM